MRIIPWELLKVCPTLSLEAIRKEIFMYDHSLINQKNNQAMELFLNLGRNYFDCLTKKWVTEMQVRNLYVNSFITYYAKTHNQEAINTDWWLILECIVQWDLKLFKPYKTTSNWFEIALTFKPKNIHLSLIEYNELKDWYKKHYMKPNHNNLLKPYKLNIQNVVNHFQQTLLT